MQGALPAVGYRLSAYRLGRCQMSDVRREGGYILIAGGDTTTL